MMRRASRRLVCRKAAAAVPVSTVTACRGVYDSSGYELPFGKSKADRVRESAAKASEVAGVRIEMPRTLSQKQWTSPGTDLSAVDEDELFKSDAPHAVEMRRSRMANMRAVVEGVSIKPRVKDPFNNYFKKRDGEPLIDAPDLSLPEIEDMLGELQRMQFPAEDEELLHRSGSIIDDEEAVEKAERRPDFSVSIDSQRRERKEAAALKRQIARDREHGVRAPCISDEVERKLLIAVCYQLLAQRLTNNDAQRHITGRTTFIDPRTGASPPAESEEARKHPHLYMRYGLDDAGTVKAFKVIEEILEVDSEQNYEAIRYHAELAVASGQLWRLSDTLRLCRGFPILSERDPDYREMCTDVCEEILASVVSEWMMKCAIDSVNHDSGEGSAARNFLDQLRDCCSILGERGSRNLLEQIVDDCEGMMIAFSLHKGEAPNPSLLEGLPKLRGTSTMTCAMQSVTAILRTLVGTELPLVVDPNGVLQFTCFARLYGVLKHQNRVHESWFVAEDMLRFHDEYKGRLALDYKAQQELFARQVKDITGYDMHSFATEVDESDPYTLVHRVVPVEEGLVPTSEKEEAAAGSSPAQEDAYSTQMRQIHLGFLADRLAESRKFGHKLIERAITERYRDHHEAWRLLALSCFKNDLVDDAIAAARHAMALQPNDAQVHVMLAAFHWDKKEYLMAKREERLAELVEAANRKGRVITLADLEFALESAALLDERKKVIAEQQDRELADADDWSAKFFLAKRRHEVDAIVAPEVEAGVAQLPPVASELVLELSKVTDNPGDDVYKEWAAHMSWVNRYSKAISKPRTPRVHDQHWDKSTERAVTSRTIHVDQAYMEPKPPELY